TVRSTKQKVLISDEGVSGQLLSDSALNDYAIRIEIPDILAYIQSKTELTRDTILQILKKSDRINEVLVNPQMFMDNATNTIKKIKIPYILAYKKNNTELTRDPILQILKKSGRINEVLVNPQMFMDNATNAIKNVLYDLMIDGIKYEKIGGKMYEMTLFDDTDFEIYIDNFTHTVSNAEKTIYDNYIPLDSGVENQFAKDCETSQNIEFYFKLPNWFKIPTPIGNYNPDWAVVFRGEKKIYFVAETKSEGQELLKSEKQKIKCGKEHFKDFTE